MLSLSLMIPTNAGSMIIASFIPSSPLLKEFIECFYILEHAAAEEPESFLILPGTDIYVSFSLNTAIRIKENVVTTFGTEIPAFDSTVQAGLKRPCIYRYEGNVKEICIRFKQPGAYAFFDQSIFSAIKPASSFIPFDDYISTMTALAGISDHNDLISKLELYFSEKCKPITYTYLFDVIKELQKTDPDDKLNLDELAGRHGISRQALRNQFAKYFHFSPSEFRQVCRFRKFIQARLNEQRQTNLTNTVYDIGFFDQSHLIKDFKKYSFLKPKEFFRKVNFSEDRAIMLLWQ
jgi:AraC-like DNA-binding protein